MENQASSKSIILNYGLVLGVIGILTSLALYATGNLIEMNWLNGVVGFVAMIVIIILGIKKFKADNGGYLSFGQGVKVGMFIALLSAVISIIYNQVFINFIEPDFMNQMLEVQKTTWEEANMTQEQMEAAEGMFETFSSPLITSLFAIVGAAFFGFIISAISAAVMKKSAEDQY
ncbi:MAG: DUF4199 domain-containing protein [Flavobacteriaceae bacterium]